MIMLTAEDTNTLIRRANPEDALGIHQAHMKSIHENCAKDYEKKQIEAWGGRDFNENKRIHSIKNDHVWVVEKNKKIEGFCHLKINVDNKSAEIMGLYITKEVLKKSFGKRLLQEAEKETVKIGIRKLILFSTYTAKNFYQSQGFKIIGSEKLKNINGVDVQCIPMEKLIA